MKISPLTLLVLPVTLCLTQCVELDQNGNIPGTYGQTSGRQAGFTQPLTSSNGLGTVTIRDGGRVVSTIRTAKPNIEQTRWYQEQEQIVVKSRGNHGPATVQLFDTRSGSQLGTVMAYELSSGGPDWARGMAE